MSPAHPPRILVAEDDPVSRRLLQYTLQRAGYSVVVVENGLKAWYRLQQADIDLLIADHQMPFCSGIALLRQIEQRAKEDGQRLVPTAILCTAKGHEIDHEQLKAELKLLAVLGKPFSPLKLTRIIDQHFGAPSENTSVPNRPAPLYGLPSWGSWPTHVPT